MVLVCFNVCFFFVCLFVVLQGLDSHRHSAAHFEDTARRRGLQLICIDRPGRGRSDTIPFPVADAGKEGEVDLQALMSEKIEDSVVDTVKQVGRGRKRMVGGLLQTRRGDGSEGGWCSKCLFG